jgi:hypothetical protein
MGKGGQMNLRNVEITPLENNPADYNIKADITEDDGTKIGDFGPDGIDVFTWWVQQDEAFRLNIVNQFSMIMASEIVSGAAE